MNKISERPGLGAQPPPVGVKEFNLIVILKCPLLVLLNSLSFLMFLQQRKKKEHVVWDHATYKQAVRKAMFARFKELEWSHLNTSSLWHVKHVKHTLVHLGVRKQFDCSRQFSAVDIVTLQRHWDEGTHDAAWTTMQESCDVLEDGFCTESVISCFCSIFVPCTLCGSYVQLWNLSRCLFFFLSFLTIPSHWPRLDFVLLRLSN